MNHFKLISLAVVLFVVGLACGTSTNEAEVPPTETAVVEVVPPTATPLPPTETPPPPTETPVPLSPIEINSDVVGDDGCILVNLNTGSWEPMSTSYTGGGDPFFHIHSNEADFYLSVELYTAYGAGWAGQLGTFPTQCTSHGICIYLVPDNTNAYLASAGEIEIIALAESGGSIQTPIQFTIRDLTFSPVSGTTAASCYHVDEVVVDIQN